MKRKMLSKKQILNELQSLIEVDAESETSKSYWKGYRDALCYVAFQNPSNYKFKWER
ncbi:MAG: hypothetical protein QXG39_06260 [Candidatus Aenigmatarchaeota archaeon]